MEKHYGQIVEFQVRKNGYSLTDLAIELSVNRRTIYNYFENKFLKTEVIFKIGCIIRHDFSIEFPELFTKEDFVLHNNRKHFARQLNRAHSKAIVDDPWKDKYLNLLEAYNQVLLNKLNKTATIEKCL
ncbi:hypothetical protein FPZ43_11380 [Mucilaginibacter pallidiroseus]|uniref:Uncharacterized protein n=1 Tax=Mucilaginibacter pallidiroseus TaxID=2599295 RepID=A0A563UBX9_9SPHI|nr:hypothetical protein [Mucilaginibacter pallidiroseus]TWR28865.1 hypothetical protein FPZ43_11380 [Mucilaginibacter pallidiroseus]